MRKVIPQLLAISLTLFLNQRTDAAPRIKVVQRVAAATVLGLAAWASTIRAPIIPDTLPTDTNQIQQQTIWGKVVHDRYKPPFPAGSNSAALTARTLVHLGASFEHRNEMPATRKGYKMVHRDGVALPFVYHALPDYKAPFTGLLSDSEVFGIARLSLGTPQQFGKPRVTGIALKFFRGTQLPADTFFLSLHGTDGQMSANFFVEPFTNALPKPTSTATRIGAAVFGTADRGNALYQRVDHLSAFHSDGSRVKGPIGAYRLLLQPAFALAQMQPDPRADFREVLCSLPPGKLFDVYAITKSGIKYHVGSLISTDSAAASYYEDHVLFFGHNHGKPAGSS